MLQLMKMVLRNELKIKKKIIVARSMILLIILNLWPVTIDF